MDERLKRLLQHIETNICNEPRKTCEVIIDDANQQTTITIKARIHYIFLAPLRKFFFWLQFKELLRDLEGGAYNNLAEANIYLKTDTMYWTSIFNRVYEIKLKISNSEILECEISGMDVYNVEFYSGSTGNMNSWQKKTFFLNHRTKL